MQFASRSAVKTFVARPPGELSVLKYGTLYLGGKAAAASSVFQHICHQRWFFSLRSSGSTWWIDSFTENRRADAHICRSHRHSGFKVAGHTHAQYEFIGLDAHELCYNRPALCEAGAGRADL